MSPKRADLDSFDNKGSTGDYAEIGPALMSSVHFYSSKSHYSEINDIMLQPPTLEASLQDSANKENLYDQPDAMKSSAAIDRSDSCHSYSKLERKVPLIRVTSCESDASDGKDIESLTLPDNNPYSKLDKSITGNALECNDVDQEGSEFSTESLFVHKKQHLPPILENHTYNILEQTDTSLDTDYQPGNMFQDRSEHADRNDDSYEYDRLVSPQLYQILDRSAGLSRIYDIQSGPCTKIEGHLDSQAQCKRKVVANLELSTEIFDDEQYLSPVPTPNSANRSAEMSDQNESDKRDPSKYCGDYERDPNYMTSNLLPPNLYQPIKVNAMDPIPAYENYLKPQAMPTCSDEVATKEMLL